MDENDECCVKEIIFHTGRLTSRLTKLTSQINMSDCRQETNLLAGPLEYRSILSVAIPIFLERSKQPGPADCGPPY